MDEFRAALNGSLNGAPDLALIDARRPLRVLLVEDDVEYARLVRVMLETVPSVNFQPDHMASARTASDRLVRDPWYDVLLLDLGLPDAQGLEALTKLLPLAPDLPIVVLSGSENEAQAVRAVKTGAQDYLIKGETTSEGLVRAIRYAIERKQSELEVKRLAYYDSLTQLPNRRMLMDRLSSALSRARRHDDIVGVIFLDVDQFKEINDTLGHDAGDRLLEQIAGRLTRVVRESDTVARLSGDEFVVVVEVQRLSELRVVADTLLSQLDLPFQVADRELTVTASIGIGSFPADGTHADDLLRAADRAMYRTKSSGERPARARTAPRRARASVRSALVAGIPGALERGELRVHYQPIVELRHGRLEGFEALVRWQHPTLGLVGPSAFLPIAEQSEIILGMERWVLETALAEAVKLPLRMAINLSRRHLDHPALLTEVKEIGRRVGYDLRRLELEITESGRMREPTQVLRHLKGLRRLGVKIVVDDFGTGYSSLSLMKQFPLDALKLERKFVKHCASNRTDQALIAAVIGMAHALGLQVTAEGVETAAQLAFLRAHNCDRAQGSYFSRPVPASRLQSILNRKTLIRD